MLELGNSYMISLYGHPCVICNCSFPNRFASNGWRHHIDCVACQQCGEENMIMLDKPVNRLTNFGCINCKHTWSYTFKEIDRHERISEKYGF